MGLPDWEIVICRLLGLYSATDDATTPDEREWVEQQFWRIAEHLNKQWGTRDALPFPDADEFEKVLAATFAA